MTGLYSADAQWTESEATILLATANLLASKARAIRSDRGAPAPDALAPLLELQAHGLRRTLELLYVFELTPSVAEAGRPADFDDGKGEA